MVTIIRFWLYEVVETGPKIMEVAVIRTWLGFETMDYEFPQLF